MQPSKSRTLVQPTYSLQAGPIHQNEPVARTGAIDVFTRFAVTSIVLGTPSGVMTARFIAQALRLYRRHGVRVRAILTDNGSEYVAGTFVEALVAKELRHVRIPARSPNHNAVCERFQGTMLRVLAPRLPSSSLHLHPPTASRSRRLADHLQPPPA